MLLPLFKRADEFHKRALALRRSIGDTAGIGQSLQLSAFSRLWQGDYHNAIALFEEAREVFRKIGDRWEYGVTINGLCHCYHYLSDYRQKLHCSELYYEVVNTINDDNGIAAALSGIADIYTEQGDFPRAEQWALQANERAEERGLSLAICYSVTNLGYLALERGDIEKAIAYLKRGRMLFDSHNFIKEFSVQVYSYLADALVERCLSRTDSVLGWERAEAREVCNRALSLTRPWPNRYGSALRAMAKYHAFTGDDKKAAEGFRAAVEQTHSLGRKYEYAKSCYEYGRFLGTRRQTDEARIYLRQAVEVFTQIKANAYITRSELLLASL
jgi:tetratricopeptide (TPR) repeat protein